MVRVERHPNGPRVRVLGVRIHHYQVGMLLIALGVGLVWDDRHDVPHRRPFDPVVGVTTSNAQGGW